MIIITKLYLGIEPTYQIIDSHYINPDNYFINILSMIIKVIIKRSLLKRYFDSSCRENIKYTLALVFFILLNVNKSDIILFHGSYRVLVFFSKIFKNYNFIYYRHGGNMLNIEKKDLKDILSFCKVESFISNPHINKSSNQRNLPLFIMV